MINIFNIIVLILDLIGALLLLYILYKSSDVLVDKILKTFLWLGALGLISQAYRNFVFLGTGVSPSDNNLQLWVLKDFSLIVLSIYMLLHIKDIICFIERNKND